MTPVQAKFIETLRTLSEGGVCPSYEELRFAMGISSKSEIHRIVTALKAQGLVTSSPMAVRSLRIVETVITPLELHLMSNTSLRELCRRAEAEAVRRATS